NKAFRIEDVDQFIAAMTADIPPPPPDAARTRAANAGSRS
ncbi:MAG: MBL fold metallo-hydrolase, partial [Mesorhizobium sp.]